MFHMEHGVMDLVTEKLGADELNGGVMPEWHSPALVPVPEGNGQKMIRPVTSRAIPFPPAVSIDIRNHGRIIRLSTAHAGYARSVANNFGYLFGLTQHGPVADFSRPQWHTMADGQPFHFPSLPEDFDGPAAFPWKVEGKLKLAFDAGAYAGLSTVYLSQIAEHVVAFEPDPLALESLRMNLAVHGIRNVAVVPCALGPEGRVRFSPEGCLGSALSGVLDRPAFAEEIEVESHSLEWALQQFGVPDFLKLDIEGAEVQVIMGLDVLCLMGHTAKVPYLFIDTAHRVGGEHTNKHVAAILRCMKYETVLEGLLHGAPHVWARS